VDALRSKELKETNFRNMHNLIKKRKEKEEKKWFKKKIAQQIKIIDKIEQF
jgi:hypothetical protein